MKDNVEKEKFMKEKYIIIYYNNLLKFIDLKKGKGVIKEYAIYYLFIPTSPDNLIFFKGGNLKRFFKFYKILF